MSGIVHHRPILSGIATGLLALWGVSFLAAFLGWTAVSWPLAALVLIGFAGPPMFQASLLLPLCTGIAALHSMPAMPLFLPSCAALAAGNLLIKTESSSLWTIDHAGFGLACFISFFSVLGLAQGLGGLGHGMLATFFFLGFSAAFVIACRIAHDLLSEPSTESSAKVHWR
jgi:hypothetical protein